VLLCRDRCVTQAITRAQERLMLMYCRKKPWGEDAEPSSFLQDLVPLMNELGNDRNVLVSLDV
jgi:superfamily I DNA/RNA helicase